MQNSIAERQIKRLVFSALLSAMSIVLGKYLTFNVGTLLRFSLENLPIIFAGAAFGPITGLLVGVAADLIGCLMVGYEINPIITVGAGVIGLVAGVYRYIGGEERALLRLAVIVFFSHFIGSVLIKTLGLHMYYDTPFMILLLWRVVNYLTVATVEWLILYRLIENKSIKAQIKILRGSKR